MICRDTVYAMSLSSFVMGKSLPSTTRLPEVAGIRPNQGPRLTKLGSKTRVGPPSESARVQVKLEQLRVKMEGSSEEGAPRRRLRRRQRLEEVVSECEKRWFEETLEKAEAGDGAMQVLVGQMYYSGYGVVKDSEKGHAWMSKASKNQPMVWKLITKHPGYNTSDLESDDAD